jgi:outer membrane protein assembly factor BamA
MSTYLNRFFLLLALLSVVGSAYAQDILKPVLTPPVLSSKPYVDSTDLQEIVFGKDESDTSDGIPKKGEFFYFILPLISYNPAQGTNFGVGITAAFQTGNPLTTAVSSFSGSINVTTKEQLMATAKGTVMFPDNEWELLTDFRYFIYSQSTYGLGTDYSQPVKEGFSLGGHPIEPIPGEQPMNFDHFRSYITLFKKLGGTLYAGLSYKLDYHYHIVDRLLNLTDTPAVVTSHYAYSTLYGYDPSKYISSGIGLNILYDDRDHTMNPYTGQFLQMALEFYPEWMGSSKYYSAARLDLRKYVSLSEERPRHLLAFWLISMFSMGGHPPYLDLPASGYDMFNSSARGYLQGRWRGQNWVDLEAEYRFPITNNGLLGGVIFANGFSLSRSAVSVPEMGITTQKLALFESFRFAVGGGLRIMLDRKGRMNLTIEYGRGENGSSGLYIYVGEAF